LPLHHTQALAFGMSAISPGLCLSPLLSLGDLLDLGRRWLLLPRAEPSHPGTLSLITATLSRSDLPPAYLAAWLPGRGGAEGGAGLRAGRRAGRG
jgi:hypothetical protein